jgi:nucleoside transporter
MPWLRLLLTGNIRLKLMMFLNYVIWGAWYVTITSYLTSTLKFSGDQAGAIFGTFALACMISPFFVGLVADRFFSTEKVLAVLHLLGAVLLYLMTQVTSFAGIYGIMLGYCICYCPTIALTNSLTLRNIKNAGDEFPLIRVYATLGWIFIGVIVGWLHLETSATQFLLAAAASVAMSLFCLTLPHTPPADQGEPITVRTVLGLDALVMMKRPAFLIFVVASVLACIPLTFYFSFTGAYLEELKFGNVAGKMTLGQVSEVGAMLLMPLIFRKFSLKAIMLGGLFAWSVRYALLAYGDTGGLAWMFFLAILLHGICFDCFFMTGQLYTDQEAPPKLRSSAQGLLAFLTYGVGMYIGSRLSGVAVDYFTTGKGETAHRNWNGFWLSSAIGAFAIFLLVAVFFHSSGKIRAKEPEAVAAD